METPEFKFVEILGVKVPYRALSCNPLYPFNDHFKLTVHVTDACPCDCKFCCNALNKGAFLDVEKFRRDYEAINAAVTLDEVYLTGGEPTLFWDKIKECLAFIKQPVTINTMGLYLDRIDEPVGISLSRHHWEHEVNESILGIKIPKDYIEKFPYKERMNISCNLIKGQVEDEAGMRKMLDFSMDNDIGTTGFVALLPVNEYSIGNVVPIPHLTGDDVLTYREFNYPTGTCSCSNFCYSRGAKTHRFYVKRNLCPTENRGGRIMYRNGIQPWFQNGSLPKV